MKGTSLSPKEAGKFISGLAQHVFIKEEGIKKLGTLIVDQINSQQLSVGNFSQNDFHPKSQDPWSLDWLFVVDSLNFCFWHLENEEGWVVDGKSGYFALCNAVNRAMRENVDILNPHFYSKVTQNQLSNILRSDTNVQIPLLAERISSLHEIGSVLLKKFNGSFKDCVIQANNSAVQLLKIITDNFKCFRDEAIYKGTKVSFLKRAQILIGDIWSCYKNEGLGYFEDIDEITMFADYRVPQSLLYHNVVEYSDELLKVLNSQTILEYGDEMESEIRGCSIHAVTLLVDYVKQYLHNPKTVNAILIDHFLWDFRRSHAKEIVERELPFHKIFCIYY